MLGALLHAVSADAAPKRSHRVKEGLTTLSEIATYLYGTVKYVPKIAEWNGLKEPYPVWVGMRLRLREEPTLTPAEGAERIAEMRARLGRSARPIAETESKPKAEPQVSAPAAPSAPAAVVAPKAPRGTVTPPKPAEDPVITSSFEAELKQQAERREAEKEEPAEIEQAETLVEAAQKDLDAGQFDEALAKIRRARKLDSDLLAPRLLEVRALDRKGEKAQAREQAQDLASDHPELAAVPWISRILNEEGGE